ncbi:MAG: 7-cyano-7-deazaguanine synthase QueC, partial [Candidatus Nanoarchaeia archaeon]|nr:7-cyano-7-deazaguanine synthase QueC [Candidatus Nanoarchaeia archaeon]
GMDTTTILYELVKKYSSKDVLAISFDYGSKHNQFEIQKALMSCKKLKVQHKIVDIKSVFELFKSALLLKGEKIPKGHYEDKSMKKTVVPFRNGILLAIATGIAESKKIKKVYYGAHGGDHAIYPDCRNSFLEAMSLTAKEGTYEKIQIEAPYMKLDKTKILKRGLELNVNYKLTHTCYDPDEFGRACGKCGACTERLESFSSNKVKDPVLYQL